MCIKKRETSVTCMCKVYLYEKGCYNVGEGEPCLNAAPCYYYPCSLQLYIWIYPLTHTVDH